MDTSAADGRSSGAARVVSPEARRLLATVRNVVHPDPPGADRVAPGNERVDGERLLDLALRERAVSVLWNDLSPDERSALPRNVRESFRRLARVEEFRMRKMASGLESVLFLLSDHGIQVVLIKGAALAHVAYESLAERPMVDLDLLVEPDRAREARHLLLNHGWSWPSDRFPDEMYERHFHLPPLKHDDGTDAVLEIHTDLFPEGHPFAFGGDDVRRRSCVRSVRGVTARVPDPVDHLLYVCIHFAWNHRMERGAWRTFRDVSLLADDSEFSWDEFARRAIDARAASCCYWTLLLARGMGRIPVPTGVLTPLRPGVSEFVEGLLKRHFALKLLHPRRACPSIQLGRWMWRLAIHPVRSGHGDARPWSHAEDFASLRPGPPKKLGARLTWHVSNLGRWRRYASSVLGATSNGPVESLGE